MWGAAWRCSVLYYALCLIWARNGNCASIPGYTKEASLDAISSLPGWGQLDFGLFGGYIMVDKDAGRALYYVLAERVEGPDTAPLALWLNGGPGCSSIGGGFMSELGPFYPTQGEGGHELERNEFSWNTVASVIFLESPAFVGFSYSNRSKDVRTGDRRTTADTLEFLLRFWERFPQYKDRDFWITGESYAGHYIPLLAEAIVDYNNREDTPNKERINLKGFLLGNPWTDAAMDNIGQVDFLVNHFMMSRDSGRKILKYCDIYTIWPLPHNKLPPNNTRPASSHHRTNSLGPMEHRPDRELCRHWMKIAFDEIGAVDVYDIYEDLCPSTRATREVDRLMEVLSPLSAGQTTKLALKTMAWNQAVDTTHPSTKEAQLPKKEQHRKSAAQGHLSSTVRPPRKALQVKQDVRHWPNDDARFIHPCIQQETEHYLNMPEVQAALHANTTGLPYKWSFCSPTLRYSLEDSVQSMLPVYRRLVQKDSLHIVVYSGTVDAAVPTTGTQRWVESLSLPIKRSFRAWTDPERQVGGHVVEYDGLTFVMVRNAGHMVPYTQPVRALHMVSTFLKGKAL